MLPEDTTVTLSDGRQVTITSESVTTSVSTYSPNLGEPRVIWNIQDLSHYLELVESVTPSVRHMPIPQEMQELKELPKWVTEKKDEPKINTRLGRRNLIIFKGK